MENKKKERILNLVQEYYSETNEDNTLFIPGISPIHASGIMVRAKDIASIVNYALDGWFTEFKACDKFKRDLKLYLDKKHCILVNSGSSASLVAVSTMVENYPDGKFILTTALAFPTTVSPIYQNNKIPIYVDVDLNTLSPNLEQVERFVAEHGDGVADLSGAIFTHTLGMPYPEYDIRKIIGEDRFLISDSCDALGANVKREKDGQEIISSIGEYSDMITQSYFAAHMISTAGEGGAILFNNPKYYKPAFSYVNWGKSCFPKDTPITTDIGIKKIQDLQPGDIVITHNGNESPVTDALHRKYSGKVYKINCRNRPRIIVTEEHPFLVYVGGNFVWKAVKDLKISDILVEKVSRLTVSENKFIWKYKTVANEKFEVLDFDDALFRLIGYWLSQGNVAKGLKGKSGYKENKYFYYRVDFSFHVDKKEIINDLKIQMEKSFGCSGVERKDNNSKVAIISFKSRKAYEFFSQFCGCGAANKHIPYVMMRSNPERLIHAVWGFVLGDGNKNFQGYNLSSISYELIEQMRRILLQNGILTSAHVRTKDKHKESIVNGKVIEQKHDLWTLSLYGVNAERFSNLSGDYYKARTKKRMTYIKDGYAHYKIRDIESYNVLDLDVYNVEVEKDHSYHAWGVAVHNCFCIPGQDNACGERFSKVNQGKMPDGYDHKYIFDRLGYNLKMTELQAAMGITQLEYIDYEVEMRKETYLYLYSALAKSNAEHLDFLSLSMISRSSPFGFPIFVKEDAPFSANDLIFYLEQNQIKTRRFFAGNITKQPGYMNLPYLKGDLSVTDYIMNNGFWIGCHSGITAQMIAFIQEKIEDFMEKY
jgi:dTDP-4-amino-4,6-dideoxygalactose transaminase/intein/homing endonuclease